MTTPRANFDAYVATFRNLAIARGVLWNLPFEDSGRVSRENRWPLHDMLGAPTPPAYWLNDLGRDARTLEVLNEHRRRAGEPALGMVALAEGWRDLIKAATIEQAFVKRTSPSHIYGQILRPLRALATCVPDKEPWSINRNHVEVALGILADVQASGKLRDIAEGLIQLVLDGNSISAHGPLLVRQAKGTRQRKATATLRGELEQRKNAEQLPEAEAFWELVRIVFTETPRSFYDCLRFEMAKLMILLGLRGTEIATLPEDCLRYRDYVDGKGRPAAASGGVSRSLRLRHFAEKQRLTNQHGVVLYENTVDVPPIFENAVFESVERVRTLTAPLRTRLRQQVETGRCFPELDPDDVVSLLGLYPRLTGNPFVFEDAERARLVEAYKARHDVSALDEMSARQPKAWNPQALGNAFRVYFSRHVPRMPIIDLDTGGPMASRRRYDRAGMRIGDLEAWLQDNLASKTSDTVPFNLDGERQLQAHEMLFLGPKRALAEERNDGICDVARYAFVGRLTLTDVAAALSGSHPTVPTLFAKYGRTERDRKLTITSHDFRHLMNTELFRVGVADTVITKRFNRKSVQQSYEYDHRSLAEDLDAVEVPKEHDALLFGHARTVFKMISAGKGKGPIADQFLAIQKEEGDEAAIVFLAAEADGFHLTPYGACLNSFVAEPCPKHLECFNGCIHLHRTALPSEDAALRKLEGRLVTLVDSLENHPGSAGAKANARRHAQQRLDAIRRALATPQGEPVFPEGEDLSRPLTQPFRGPFKNVP